MKFYMGFFSLVFLVSCGGGSSSPEIESTPPPTIPVSNDCETQNIYNRIFTQRDSDCAAFYGAEITNCSIAEVRDLTRSLSFTSNVTLASSETSCTLSSDAIPNHDFNDSSANFRTDATEIQRDFVISRNPSIAEVNSDIDGGSWDAIMINGVVVDLKSAGCYSPSSPNANSDGNIAAGCGQSAQWNLVPLEYTSMFGVDIHNAHVQPDGTYHYHGNPNALFDDSPSGDGSPVIGWAADGFPIYGSYILEGSSGTYRKVISGYALKEGSRGEKTSTNPGGLFNGIYELDWEWADSGDLDECNGMTYKDKYGYYVTDGYPYIINCYKGTPDSSFLK